MKPTIKTLMSALVLASALNASASQYEWDLSGNTNPSVGTGTLSILSGTPSTSYGTTTINGQSDTYLNVPKMTSNVNQGIALTFDASTANGGGSYINQYTLIEDIYVPSTSNAYIPLFQTAPGNTSGNDADFYISPSGALGDGGSASGLGGYSSSKITYGAWNRIALTINTAGAVNIYDNGTNIYTNSAYSAFSGNGLDGRYSLYYDGAGANKTAPDALLFNEGYDTTGTSTAPLEVSAIAFQDSVLSSAQVSALGGVNADGIFAVPEPTTFNLACLAAVLLIGMKIYRSEPVGKLP